MQKNVRIVVQLGPRKEGQKEGYKHIPAITAAGDLGTKEGETHHSRNLSGKNMYLRNKRFGN